MANNYYDDEEVSTEVGTGEAIDLPYIPESGYPYGTTGGKDLMAAILESMYRLNPPKPPMAQAPIWHWSDLIPQLAQAALAVSLGLQARKEKKLKSMTDALRLDPSLGQDPEFVREYYELLGLKHLAPKPPTSQQTQPQAQTRGEIPLGFSHFAPSFAPFSQLYGAQPQVPKTQTQTQTQPQRQLRIPPEPSLYREYLQQRGATEREQLKTQTALQKAIIQSETDLRRAQLEADTRLRELRSKLGYQYTELAKSRARDLEKQLGEYVTKEDTPEEMKELALAIQQGDVSYFRKPAGKGFFSRMINALRGRYEYSPSAEGVRLLKEYYKAKYLAGEPFEFVPPGDADPQKVLWWNRVREDALKELGVELPKPSKSRGPDEAWLE